MLQETAILAEREIAPRGFEPLEANRQELENKELTEGGNPVLSTGLDKLLQNYPELQALVKAWPGLPEQIKTAIRTLIETDKGQKK